MDFEGSQNEVYLRRYYAGQAMNGLLANRGLHQSLSPTFELGADEKGAERLAKLACDIAEAMVCEVTERFS